jgi:hypothetical protein
MALTCLQRGIPNRADIPWLQAINVHLTLFNTIYLVNSFGTVLFSFLYIAL